jgi:anti-anti-sigma factor
MAGDGNGRLWENERMIDLETKSELLEGGTCVVSVAGVLDMATAPRFKQTLLGALGDVPASVIIDLTECEFIDSSALGILNRRTRAPRRRRRVRWVVDRHT